MKNFKKRIKKYLKFILNHKNKGILLVLYGLLILLSASILKPSAITVFKNTPEFTNNNKKLPIYSVDTSEKKISISFDASWGNEDTNTILQILEEENIKATFFLSGYWSKKYIEDVKTIHAAGHDLGNHGDTHAHGAKLSKEQNINEIQGAHDKVKDILGIDMNLFRPPFGEYNNNVIEAAEALNYYTIQWDIDSHDWMAKGFDYEVNQVLNNKNLKDGSIILFHNDTKNTPETLPLIIKGLKEKGYSIVPISELIIKDNFKIDLNGRQTPK